MHKLCECSVGKSTNRYFDEHVELPVAVSYIKELFFNPTTMYFGKFDFLAGTIVITASSGTAFQCIEGVEKLQKNLWFCVPLKSSQTLRIYVYIKSKFN